MEADRTMNILKKLTRKNLKLNKKRTIVTIVGISLAVALLMTVSTMYASLIESIINYQKHDAGDFHAVFYDVDAKDMDVFEQNKNIDKVFYTEAVGYAKLDGCKNEYKPYAFIASMNKESMENLSVRLVSGRLPENDSEIVIPTHLKTNGRIEYKVGDTVAFEVGKRVSEGSELAQTNPLICNDEEDDKTDSKEESEEAKKATEKTEEKEEITDTQSKTYTVVGIVERPAYNIEPYDAPGYTMITCNADDASGKVNVYARFNKDELENIYKDVADIIGVDADMYTSLFDDQDNVSNYDYSKIMAEVEKAKYCVDYNNYLVQLETDPLSLGGSDMQYVVGVVLIIIIITSVFCIKNSFDISVTEKVKQYGMLRSVGATKKQIRKTVLCEAFELAKVGIPTGLAIGMLASFILIKLCNLLVASSFEAGLVFCLKFSWIGLIVSILLGVVTIYLSAIFGAIKASRVSPIELVRNSARIKVRKNRYKSPKIITKIFGIGGDISHKNIKRNNKKYRTTIISIIVSVAVFIAVSEFINLAFDSVNSMITVQDYDVSVQADVSGDKEAYNRVLETVNNDEVKRYSIVNSFDYIEVSKDYGSKQFKNEKVMGYENDENNTIYVSVVSVGEKEYKHYLDELGLKYDDVKDKAILIDTLSTFCVEKNKKGEYKEGSYESKKIKFFEYEKGDTIEGKHGDDESRKIEVAKVTETTPMGMEYYYEPFIVVSDEYRIANSDEKYEKGMEYGSNLRIYYEAENPDKLQDAIESATDDLDIRIQNNAEEARKERKILALIAIFMYGFITVISLIGVTNIFNTITASVELRKREFAMLRSIGMTNKEFSKMMALESIFIGFRSLIFGIPIGVVLSYFMHTEMVEGLPFKPPYMAIVISILAVITLIMALMKYSMNKINKCNTIETIRNENI